MRWEGGYVACLRELRIPYNLTSSVWWDITPCSLIKVNQCFGGIFRLHLRGRRCMRHVSPKCRLTCIGLNGVISQKVQLYIATAVRTSNPAYNYLETLKGGVHSRYSVIITPWFYIIILWWTVVHFCYQLFILWGRVLWVTIEGLLQIVLSRIWFWYSADCIKSLLGVVNCLARGF
jgi:hypothetical protein